MALDMAALPATSQPESPMLEGEDIIYACKGCGDILEEGKAFELAGNRWHIQCFRCNTCGTNLDSDANLLLLGDGSLICNKCTYSCSVCNEKIEDLAILTGDQAFCANCFRCRNCKKKIENLKYARTSQGIFCMQCHESLMQRRRKKSSHNKPGNPRHKTIERTIAPHISLDKSLPSLPFSPADRKTLASTSIGDSQISNEGNRSTDTQLDMPTPTASSGQVGWNQKSQNLAPKAGEQSQRPTFGERSLSVDSKNNSALKQAGNVIKENVSPRAVSGSKQGISDADEFEGHENDLYVPLRLETDPPSSAQSSRKDHLDAATHMQSRSRQSSLEHDQHRNNGTIRKSSLEHDQLQRYLPHASRNSSRQSSQPNSPHLANLDRTLHGRLDRSSDLHQLRKENGDKAITESADSSRNHVSIERKPLLNRNLVHASTGAAFTLQDAPKTRRAEKRRSRSDTQLRPKSGFQYATDRAASSSASGAHLSYIDSIQDSNTPTIDRDSAEDTGEMNRTLPPSQISRSEPRGDGSRSNDHYKSTDTRSSPRNVPQRADSLTQLSQSVSFMSLHEDSDDSRLINREVTVVDDIDLKSGDDNRRTLTAATPASAPSDQRELSRSLGTSPLHPRHPDRSIIPDMKDRPNYPSYDQVENFTSPRPSPRPPASARSHHISPTEDHLGSSRGPTSRHDSEAQSSAQAGDDQTDHGGFLRRVSKSVRHARSYSEKSNFRQSRDLRQPNRSGPIYDVRSSGNSTEVHSPYSPQGLALLQTELRDKISWLQAELQQERKRSGEKEKKLAEYEQNSESRDSIQQMTTELREKRSTMVVLDTQKELIVRELEVLTGHLEKVKNTREPVNLEHLSGAVLHDFAQALQQLKDRSRSTVEELTQHKAELMDEISALSQQKDIALMELDQLSARNMHLSDLNAQLLQQVNDMYKSSSVLEASGREIGDYSQSSNHSVSDSAPTLMAETLPTHAGTSHQQAQMSKERSLHSLDMGEHRPSLADSYLTGSTLAQDNDVHDSATYLATAPQVVNIRKAQPKKFNWKKGGQNVAKGVTKGLKGAFSSENRNQRDGSFSLASGNVSLEGTSIPYGSLLQHEHPRSDNLTRSTPANAAYSSGAQTHGAQYSQNVTNIANDQKTPGFGGFFGNSKNRTGASGAAAAWRNTSGQGQAPNLNDDGGPALFGSELELRAEYEHTNVPSIVTRCIQEVEARGIEIEGIYRKSGGSGQVQVIKDGFEQSTDYDISDPDLDINAVTSTLKQYFRKLPTPLITYEVYNELIETASGLDQDGTSSAVAGRQQNGADTTRIANMRHALDGLPPSHRHTLEVLVLHLARVIENEAENLMTPLNVAVVFAPTIMRPESLAREMQDTQAKNSVIQFLIENCQAIFAASGSTGANGSE